MDSTYYKCQGRRFGVSGWSGSFKRFLAPWQDRKSLSRTIVRSADVKTNGEAVTAEEQYFIFVLFLSWRFVSMTCISLQSFVTTRMDSRGTDL